MRAALYDPDAGYYTRHIRTVGTRGDFSTTPTLDPALARATARWLTTCWQQGLAPKGTVIEVGAGDGALASGVRQAIGLRRRLGLHYHIVEASPPLAKMQRARIGRHRCFHWHQSVAAALDALAGQALIISNELVDAFPATLLEWGAGDGSWREIQLHDEAGRWVERRGARYTPPLGSALAEPHSFAEGQRIERHDSYFDWLGRWLPQWRRGEMLTIDYGDEWPTLYHRRPRGTLRAYFAQQRFETMAELLARPGRQDITADVDFTELVGRGAQLGLERVSIQTQADFITAQLRQHQPGAASEPTGAGTAFKVLHQRRLR